jgi:hypothetical protein
MNGCEHIDIDRLNIALLNAAEELYKNEMIDTNMDILEIGEVAEKYEYYKDEAERQQAIENCSWATKKDWINNKIEEWLGE